jgi:signal transduction histidine kinase
MKALRGLRGKLALVFTVVFGVVAALAALAQYRQVGQVLDQGDELRLRTRAATLLARVEVEPQLVVPLPGLGEKMRVVVETPGQPPQELFHSPGFFATTTSPTRWRTVELTEPVSGSSPPRQVRLWLAHPAAPLQADLSRVRRGLALALVGSLVLAAGLAWVVGGWALRPLRRISAQARRIQSRPDGERLPEPDTGDEVQELARTLNQMLDRLREGAQLQDNFLAAAAHELRTPLAVMQAGLEVTGRAPDLPAHLQPMLAVQLDELRRLSGLVDDFLLVSRLQATSLPLTLHPVPLDELVLSTADRLLPRFRAAGRPLHLSIAEDLPDYTVQADADKLTTVLGNLLENALRHAVPNTEVRITLDREPDTGWLFAEVGNHISQPLGDLSRLTAAYYQANVLSEGAGLGLWLSNRIAELHGAPLQLQEHNQYFTARLRLPPIA